MIAWLKNLLPRAKSAPVPTPREETLADRRALVAEIDRARADLAPPAVQEIEEFRTRRRPVRVSPHLAAAYGRQPPPVRRVDEPSPVADIMLVHALLSSPPAPPAVEPASCPAPSYSSGGGGDFGGGGASSSWSSSDSSSSSSDSGSSSSSSD